MIVSRSAATSSGDLAERRIASGYFARRVARSASLTRSILLRSRRDGTTSAPISRSTRYSPSILPRYARRSQSLEVLIPVLYLKGISTGDFGEALAALVGKHAPGLSASTIARLKEAWSEEHAR